MSNKPALILKNVVRTYGEGSQALHVLNGADLEIMPGEMVAMIAPSGAGKSTLLHSAGLLERPDSGEIYIRGKATRALSDDERTKMRRHTIGFVYQFHHLLPEFSAEENLMIPQMINGLDRKTANKRSLELLDYMKIRERSDHRPSELSGGEQQRVAIARAVANSPGILLADEPTGNLDPDTASHVFATLESLVRNTGLAALIATHNHTLARKMDRCITLEAGKIIDITE
ncbi:MAG: ABC transporter ATP-binding protein [Rhizobiaceae bacterium]